MLLYLRSSCELEVSVLHLFLTVRVGQWLEIVAFPGHTHLLLGRHANLEHKHETRLKSTYNTRHVYVYLNRFEFQFLQLHINKTNKCCFFMIHNVRIPGIAK